MGDITRASVDAIVNAAPIAIDACREGAGALREVRFVLFTGDVFDAWRVAADAILGV